MDSTVIFDTFFKEEERQREKEQHRRGKKKGSVIKSLIHYFFDRDAKVESDEDSEGSSDGETSEAKETT